jgi:hypothetical protein
MAHEAATELKHLSKSMSANASLKRCIMEVLTKWWVAHTKHPSCTLKRKSHKQ